MKKLISLLLVAIMLIPMLAACGDDKPLPQPPIDTQGADTQGNDTQGGNDQPDAPEEYAPDPDAQFGGYVGVSAVGDASFDNLKITSTRLKTTLFERTFEEENPLDGIEFIGDAAAWTVVSDEAETEPNKYLALSNAGGDANIAKFGGDDWNLIQFAFKVLLAENGGGIKLYVAYKDAENYMVAEIGGDDNSHICFKKVEGGKESVETYDLPYKVPYGEWFAVSCILDSQTIKLYVKGTQIFEVYDVPRDVDLFYGGIGFGTWSTDISWDNVKVVSLDTGDVLYENDFENETLADSNWEPFTSKADGVWTAFDAGEDWHQDFTIVDDAEANPDSDHGKILKLDYTGSMTGSGIFVKSSLNNPDWKNYVFSFDARKDGGAEGFMPHFAVKSASGYEWMRWNQGGWTNTSTAFQTVTPGSASTLAQCNDKYTNGQWYHMDIYVVGNCLFGYVDGVLVSAYTK